jgi:NAD(P)-dependent dehydrogenase (short-subunit alcohol dehydrogenase family)
MDLDLKDKKVIVTGGASHIGQAIVFQLADEGAQIAIVDRDTAQAERTAEAVRARGGRAVHVVGADVGDKAVAEAACAEAMARLGGVDGLITNVGFNHPDFFLNTPPESWDALIAVNLTSVMACVRAVLPAMVAQGHGAIVATASTAAFGEPRQGVYAAAKAGVVAFIRTIALEYGRHGVRANLVAPGLTLPEDDAAVGEESLWRDRHAVMNDAQVDYVVRNTPLRRLPKARDIAHAVSFLASDSAARLITGQLITVAGGFAMR